MAWLRSARRHSTELAAKASNAAAVNAIVRGTGRPAMPRDYSIAAGTGVAQSAVEQCARVREDTAMPASAGAARAPGPAAAPAVSPRLALALAIAATSTG